MTLNARDFVGKANEVFLSSAMFKVYGPSTQELKYQNDLSFPVVNKTNKVVFNSKGTLQGWATPLPESHFWS